MYRPYICELEAARSNGRTLTCNGPFGSAHSEIPILFQYAHLLQQTFAIHISLSLILKHLMERFSIFYSKAEIGGQRYEIIPNNKVFPYVDGIMQEEMVETS